MSVFLGKDTVDTAIRLTNIESGNYLAQNGYKTTTEKRLLHFLEIGQFSGACSSEFSINKFKKTSGVNWDKYLDFHQDIAKQKKLNSNFSIIQHYVEFGFKENRSLFFRKDACKSTEILFDFIGLKVDFETFSKDWTEIFPNLSLPKLKEIVNYFINNNLTAHIGSDVLIFLHNAALKLQRPVSATYFLQLYQFGCAWCFPNWRTHDPIMVFPKASAQEYCRSHLIKYQIKALDQSPFEANEFIHCKLKNATIIFQPSVVLTENNWCIDCEQYHFKSNCSKCDTHQVVLADTNKYISFRIPGENLKLDSHGFMLNHYECKDIIHFLIYGFPKILFFLKNKSKDLICFVNKHAFKIYGKAFSLLGGKVNIRGYNQNVGNVVKKLELLERIQSTHNNEYNNRSYFAKQFCAFINNQKTEKIKFIETIKSIQSPSCNNNVVKYIKTQKHVCSNFINEEELLSRFKTGSIEEIIIHNDNNHDIIKIFTSNKKIIVHPSVDLGYLIFCQPGTIVFSLHQNIYDPLIETYKTLAARLSVKIIFNPGIKISTLADKCNFNDFYINVTSFLDLANSEFNWNIISANEMTKWKKYIGNDSVKDIITVTQLNSVFYLSKYPDVANANMNPWTHFLFKGRFEGRKARPFNRTEYLKNCNIDWDHYVNNNADIKKITFSNVNFDKVEHFLIFGVKENRFVKTTDACDMRIWSMLWPDVSENIIANCSNYKKLEMLYETNKENLEKVLEFYSKPNNWPKRNDPCTFMLHHVALQIDKPILSEFFLNRFMFGLAWNGPGGSSFLATVMPLCSIKRYCDDNNIPYIEVLPDRKFEAPPIKFYNDKTIYMGEVNLPAVVSATLHDVILCGGSRGVVSADYCFIDDRIYNIKGDIRLQISTEAIKGFGINFVSMVREVPTLRKTQGSYCSLLHELDPNYFHWMVEILPKALHFFEKLTENEKNINAVISPWLPRSLYDLLKLISDNINYLYLDYKQALLVSTCHVVGDFHQAALRNNEPLPGDQIYCEETLKRLRRALFKDFKEQFQWRRTSIPRKNNNFRFMHNASEVYSILDEIGYVSFEPNAGNLDQQREIFNSSYSIIGEGGSSFANMIFCQPGTKILILTNGDSCNEYSAFTSLARACNLDLQHLKGVEIEHSHEVLTQCDFFLPINNFKKIIGSHFGLTNFQVSIKNILDKCLITAISGLKKMLSQGENNELLECSMKIANELYTTTVKLGKQYVNNQFDEVLNQLGADVLRSVNLADKVKNNSDRERCICYISSALYEIGGHTRVLEDMIEALPEYSHRVILTNAINAKMSFHRKDILKKIDKTYSPKGRTLEDKLRSLFILLKSFDPDFIVYLSHPEDTVALASLQPGLSRKTFIIMHADHSYTMSTKRDDIFYVHLFKTALRGKSLSKNHVSINLTARTFDNNKSEIKNLSVYSNQFCTATSGSPNKFASISGKSYLEMLRYRFMAKKGLHVHIGELPNEQLEGIKSIVPAECYFKHLKYVDNLATVLKILVPNIYISSYPFGGGKAAIEAMAAGCPVASYAENGITDCSLILYPGHLSFKSMQEFYNILINYSAEQEAEQRSLSKKFFDQHHSPTQWRNDLRELLS
ncbi:uncharacterized protein Dvar_43850 [Desulfosarcina variabilis str. Montpellier]|uniref:glycosyltransferase 61 family protein n=1 Tax=Desulfosarcina variabilis TaxID=2300 RepID=UPI003AFA569E